MSVNWGQKPIVQDSIAFCLDAANPESYPGSGTLWTDVLGGLVGTWTSTPTFDPTNLGSLVHANGVYPSFVGKSFSVTGNAARSVFAWVKTSVAAQGTCIVATGSAATSQAFNLVTISPSGFKIGVMGYANDFYPASGANIFDNKWHYVGATYNGASSLITYVDAVQDNTATISYNTQGQNNYIGKSNDLANNYFWPGNIAQVQYYTRALSLAEIQKNFNAARGRYGV